MTLRNPEFQRQIWLNWRPALLAWSLGLTLLVLALPTALASAPRLASALTTTALAGLWMASLGYGFVLAGRSLSEEARHNTWDWQRLSSLSPWQMAWGKLLGAALPAWLYALWFALALAVIALVWPTPSLQLTHAVGLAVLWGLALQTWSMNLVLIGWGQKERLVHSKRKAMLPLLLLGLLGLPVLSHLYQRLEPANARSEYWWGLSLGNLSYLYLLGALVLGLGLLALWRQLCTQLDVRTLPWAWPLGLALAGFFAAGSANAGLGGFLATTAWLAMLGTAVVAVLHMEQHLRAWRQVQWSLSRQRWRSALEALPLWPISLLLALICSLPLLGLPDGPASERMGFFSACLSLQLLRDCLLLTGFALLSGSLRSPLAAFVIAWLILNIALPLLAYGVAGTDGAILLQPAIALWLTSQEPVSRTGLIAAVYWGSLVVQIALALAWVAYVFRDRVLGFAQDNPAP